ncbi:MAG: hypothetical protein H6558_11210 [Lewinellaceae bacterium]|nr:hypothetical protein [Lewinellaceae bacterium]
MLDILGQTGGGEAIFSAGSALAKRWILSWKTLQMKLIQGTITTCPVNEKLDIGANLRGWDTPHLSQVTDEQFKIDPQASNRNETGFVCSGIYQRLH